MKKILLLLVLFLCSFLVPLSATGYYFGLKSADDTSWNILQIESQLGVHLPVVSFIFDPRELHNVPVKMDTIVQQLGYDRVYHITISPNMFSAQEVADGKFDTEYRQFFEKVKEKQIKVIFRTMHEMNGGRYPWSSNPKAFKKAWIHVWQLSRSVGLDQSNILFDFSVNHRDMPTKGKPSQSATLYQCKPEKILTAKEKRIEQQRIAKLTAAEREAEKKAEEERKKKERTDCPKFEEYYPGHQYVDVVGFTFYNWGKASSNRLRLSPAAILLDREWRTLERLKALGKPLIVDEVGTTAVWYEGSYTFEASRSAYLSQATSKKEQWLSDLVSFLQKHSEIVVAVYFNVDYTYGLSFKVVGEADWAIVNIDHNRIYQGFYPLYQQGKQSLDGLATLFMHSKVVELEGMGVLVSNFMAKEVWMIHALIGAKADTLEEKVALLDTLLASGMEDRKIQAALAFLQQFYRQLSTFSSWVMYPVSTVEGSSEVWNI